MYFAKEGYAFLTSAVTPFLLSDRYFLVVHILRISVVSPIAPIPPPLIYAKSFTELLPLSLSPPAFAFD